MSDRSTPTRRRILLGIGTATTAAVAGCAGGDGGSGGTETSTETDTSTGMETETETDTPAGTARVRVAHLSPNAPSVDVLVDGSAVLEDVPFGATSDYLEVPAGERSVEITPTGDRETTVFSGAVPVEADTDYTVAATGEVGDDADESFQPVVLEDDNSDPGGDTARVQLLHAAPDAPAVDVTAGGNALFDGVAFGGSGSVEVPAGDYTLQIRGDTESNDGDAVASFDVALEGGEVYRAFAAGYLTPDDEPADTPFDLLFARGDVASAGGMGGGTARARVSHMSPNAPNVDVLVDGSAVLEDVPFGATSGYLDLAAGSHTVRITPAGDAETTVFEGDVSLEAGADYTIAAAGEVGDGADRPFQPLVLRDDNTVPGGDTARVRAVHVSPDAPAVDITVDSTGDVLFDGVAFGESGYVEVPANDYTLQIRGDTESNDGEVVADFDVSLNGGQVYTAFAAGYLTPDDEPEDTAFDLLVTQDTGMSG
ncbi:DUF4397 domain-containing protein [Haloarcula litorea]|uniref:DUF4397 domain-containing protein n=1 Tax=Haloarcula litorea TaxID=3032579 RepID=UPI0023E834FB|nr:DUF4397 domain-containing protein [Halomicroarcula sp. GDY20]